jgi:hypothetical protein
MRNIKPKTNRVTASVPFSRIASVCALAVWFSIGGAGGPTPAHAGAKTMRITFAMPSTGAAYLPGLAKPVVIEGSQLSDAEASRLDALVADSRFFEQPAKVDGTRGGRGADQREYVITIEDGGKRHTVHVSEPLSGSEYEKLRALVRFVEDKAKTLRR